jgi:RimJ/RimL family protein N-acetyltransferase
MRQPAFPHVELAEIPARKHALVLSHFGRLDEDSLSARFGMRVTQQFLHDYARRLSEEHSLVIGAFEHGRLIGVVELHVLRGVGEAHASAKELELALTVERSFQSMGIGTMLAVRALQAAAAMNADQIHACFEQRNQRMRRIARRLRMRFLPDNNFLIASLAVGTAGSCHMARGG